MKLVIIGAGNVATVLGAKLTAADHEILQTVTRQTPAAAIDQTADCYILAIADDALQTIRLPLGGKLVVHTAGAVPMGTLQQITDRQGVFYPLQSLRKEIRPFPSQIPILIDAANEKDLAIIQNLAHSISDRVSRADDATRLKLHLAAIFVNNFTNFLYTQAARLCRQENMDFNLLLPLITETAERLTHAEPEKVQTGPAVRGDRSTIEKHLGLLRDDKELQDMYRWFTTRIMEHYQLSENPSLKQK